MWLKNNIKCYTNTLSITYLQILFLICLQEACDNSSCADEGHLTNDITKHLENEEEYLRVTEARFLFLFI